MKTIYKAITVLGLAAILSGFAGGCSCGTGKVDRQQNAKLTAYEQRISELQSQVNQAATQAQLAATTGSLEAKIAQGDDALNKRLDEHLNYSAPTPTQPPATITPITPPVTTTIPYVPKAPQPVNLWAARSYQINRDDVTSIYGRLNFDNKQKFVQALGNPFSMQQFGIYTNGKPADLDIESVYVDNLSIDSQLSLVTITLGNMKDTHFATTPIAVPKKQLIDLLYSAASAHEKNNMLASAKPYQ
jgi:hypothetical protein